MCIDLHALHGVQLLSVLHSLLRTGKARRAEAAAAPDAAIGLRTIIQSDNDWAFAGVSAMVRQQDPMLQFQPLMEVRNDAGRLTKPGQLRPRLQTF
jgi:hypothetical protein